MQPNETQLAILRGRELADLDAHDRLAFANAATAEPENVAAEEAADDLTAAQRNYLAGRKVEDLSPGTDLENFAALGGEMFRPKPEAPPEPVKAAESFPPAILELDPVKIGHLPPTTRLELNEALRTVLSARKEEVAGVDPAVRRVRPPERDAAFLRVKNFLK